MSKNKLPELTSPIGTFVYPKLSEPDYGTDQYPKPDGEFAVKLRLDLSDDATQAFIRELTPHHEKAIEEAKDRFKELPVATRKKLKEISINELYNTVYDPDTEEPTGEIEFKIATKFSGEYKDGKRAGERWERKLAIFDNFGRPYQEKVQIGGGTKGRLRAAVMPYFVPANGMAGVSLKLQAVQIVDLVQGGQRTAEDYGFGQVTTDFGDADRPSDVSVEVDDENDGDF